MKKRKKRNNDLITGVTEINEDLNATGTDIGSTYMTTTQKSMKIKSEEDEMYSDVTRTLSKTTRRTRVQFDFNKNILQKL